MNLNGLYQPVLNSLLTAVLLVDSEFRITWANATAEQILSTSSSQLCQYSIFALLRTIKKDNHPDDDKEYDSLQQQFEHCRALHQTFIQHDVTIVGVTQPLLVNYGISTVDNAHSQYDSVDSKDDFFYLVEIWSKDRQSRIHQEQQQHAQHHASRQIIRGLAHEVKNPLAGIYGASQLLQKSMAKFDQLDMRHLDTDTAQALQTIQQKSQTYLSIIVDETKRLNTLVNQLLGSSNLPNWQMVNIHEPLEQVLALVSVAEGSEQLKFIRDYDLSLPEIKADNDGLVQVFLNLVNNAIQALQEHPVSEPTITLRTRIAYQQTIGDIRYKSLLKIDVVDNGIGIDSALLPQIFFPLVTGRANGTGLGLALVQDIVQRHHGMVTVESQPHHTQFSVFLPWRSQTQDPTSPTA